VAVLLILAVLLSASPRVYAAASSVQNAGSSTFLTYGVSLPNSPSAIQYANDTGEPLGLGWLSEDVPSDARVTPVRAAALPTHFDWRSSSGSNWMTSVKNQGGCGSCVAFAAVGATEGQLRIQANNPSWNVDLSEQHLFSCGRGTCSGGWWISSALNYLQQYGTPDEACSPYRAQSGSSSCSNSCADWQSRAFKISSWSWTASNPSAIQAALMNGPVVAGFTVYTDFFYYTGGIYRHTWGDLEGGHAIVIVGYDSNERYWIVKNSWGAYWGESGYFRIGFGEADIEKYAATIKVSVTMVSAPSFDGDGLADLVIYRGGSTSRGNWYSSKSSGSYSSVEVIVAFEPYPGDVPLIGTFDGDGLADLVIYRGGSTGHGNWYVRKSSTGYASAELIATFGLWGGDVSLLGRFDGDSLDDLIIYRGGSAGHGDWYVRKSSLGYAVAERVATFGLWDGDVPLLGRFDGDSLDDLVIYRGGPTGRGSWYVRKSTVGYATAELIAVFGLYAGDIPLLGNFDADSLSDLLIYRSGASGRGSWYVRKSTTGYATAELIAVFGPFDGDVPLLGKFDGDGLSDLFIYRSGSGSRGQWYVRKSTESYSTSYLIAVFGLYERDIPLIANS